MQKLEFKWQEYNKGLVSHSWGVQVFLDEVNVTNDSYVIDNLVQKMKFKDRVDFFEHELWNKKNFITYIQ